MGGALEKTFFKRCMSNLILLGASTSLGWKEGGGVPLEKKFIKLLQFVTLLEPQPVDQ